VQLSKTPAPALSQGRYLGWELRDTLLLLLPGPTTLFAALYRVPLQESTVAAQVLKTGTGGIWIDGCRVSGTSVDTRGLKRTQSLSPAFYSLV